MFFLKIWYFNKFSFTHNKNRKNIIKKLIQSGTNSFKEQDSSLLRNFKKMKMCL